MTQFTTYSVMRKVANKDPKDWAEFVASFLSRDEAQQRCDRLNREHQTSEYFVEVD